MRYTAGMQAQPKVMGIVNLTPDSFSDGGRFSDVSRAVERCLELVAHGADVLDLGAESTRPGAAPVSIDEELRRLLPVLRALDVQGCPVPVSVDTTKAEVARRALDHGASWVNDVSALDDPDMAPTCAEAGCTVVLMHRRGSPVTMQADTHYADLIGEVCSFLKARAERAIQAGVDPGQLVVDPGVGFGKASEDNARLIAAVPRFAALGYPVLIGASRKRFIGDLTGVRAADQRVFGSVGAALEAARRGAAVLRVHDVAATVQALRVQGAILRAGA